MSTQWRSTSIPGLFQTSRSGVLDARGAFVKVLGEGDNGDEPPFVAAEVFWSRSGAGVFRGMHVQLPPRATRKLVFVVHGAVRDFVVDLRIGSPTYGVVHEARLDGESGALIVPDGCAHGFEVIGGEAVMIYGQEAFHSIELDAGIHYASVGIELASAEPIISARDRELPALAAFSSPFVYS